MSPPQPTSAAVTVSSPGAPSRLAAVAPPAGPAPVRAPRIAALDAARALGVLAMVVGHTLDAVLAPAVRESPAVAEYWKARGLTAPLFLMVSGWAVTVAIGRGRSTGLAIPRGRLPRVLLLLVIGAGLRWPGWDVAGLLAASPDPWTHLLEFDALQTIAISLLAAACLLALPWTRRERVLAFVLLAVLAVALGMRPPAPLPPAPGTLPPPGLALALSQAAGGTSPFPLFPWSAYFFAGCILALLAGGGGGWRAAAMAGAGSALILATFWTGVGAMPPADPRLVLFRIGVILVILAALSLVPAAAAARAAPLGRASLGVYALHLPVVYGWSTHAGLAGRIGPTLSLGLALALAVTVLAASFATHHGIVAARRGASALLGRIQRPELAPPPAGG